MAWGEPAPWSRIVRLFQFMTMDQMPDFLTYEAALRDGRAVVAVRVPDRPSMLAARDRLLASGGHFMNFFGRLSTEELVRWRDPKLELPVTCGADDPDCDTPARSGVSTERTRHRIGR